MRTSAEILAEVREAISKGHKEIQLLGQIVNRYRAPDDQACDLPALLERIDAVPGVRRIRFASPHPRHVTTRLVHAIRDLPSVCKHLHLPVQSGSSSVLAAMRRRHTREDYLNLVGEIRQAVPGIALSTDMIVGFPGEADEDFDATRSLVEAVRFDSMFSFRYSERPNTFAVKHLADTVPDGVKAVRLQALQELQRDVQLQLHGEMVGTLVEVLVDAQSRRRAQEMSGRTTGNVVVNFPGVPELLGRMVQVRILRGGPNSVWGDVVHAES